MNVLRTVIVDDEQPGRDVVENYLRDFEQIELVECFSSPSKALGFLNASPVDLLFLDIQMPGLNGFELIAKLDEIPQVIFSTAYDEFALRAFEINAVDYLLKPYDRARFTEALQRVLQKEESRNQETQRIKALINQYNSPQNYPDRLFIRSGVKIIPVDTRDIVYVKAEGDYSRIFTSDKSYLSSTGLGDLEKKLDPELFQRSHRSFLLAVNHMKNLASDGGGGFIAVMDDGSEVKVSRSRADAIKQLIV